MNFNSIFAFWTSRPTLHDLWRHLISQMSLASIMDSLTSSAKPKLKFLLLIILMTLRSTLKRVSNLVSPIYSLSVSKQEVLKEFIEKNLNMSFIQPTLYLHSTLILFIKKKDGSLYFCVNLHGLNYISKKDCYPLPLISNLRRFIF